ncbi:MAG: T9SS C-terminal target domain-containing protein [Ignavibacteriae bacterium]|jgi:hypothetical protein|nr:T9SS C-terminal target domain-containing protein [Ignavibacteriota bacterium]
MKLSKFSYNHSINHPFISYSSLLVLHSLKKIISYCYPAIDGEAISNSVFFPYKILSSRMNKIFFLLVFGLSAIILAQQNNFNKGYELQKFVEQGGKYEENSPNIYRLTNRIGESRTFYLGSKENIFESNADVDTTIINIWEIDTTKYSSKFTFWQQVPVANISWWLPQPVEDLNNNGRPELFGCTNTIIPNIAGPVKIFERNINDIYQDIFSYDTSTVLVKGIADFNKDENKEIIIASLVDDVFFFYPVYKCDSASVLPTTPDFFFYLDTLQINNLILGDWDNNGITDCAFTTPSIWDTTMCVISEYRDSINNFEEVFRFKSIFDSDISGFAIGDFDQDNKTELVISSGPGNVFVIENEDENEYSIVNQFPFSTPNTYMQAATKDLDGNGKPEFWIGGQDFEEGITLYQCYETDRDNSYKVVASIELRYLTSLSFTNLLQAVDIDDDNKEELIISIGNVILIIKFVGSPGNHQYKLWYAKLGEVTQLGAQFYPVSIADLNGDGKRDLLIPMEKYTPSVIYNFSYILKRDKISGIIESEIKELSFEVVRAYPNPFNSESIISFNIYETSNVQLKIFNSLGKEITTLLDKVFSPGNYNISWDARDRLGNSLPSGVYLIVLKTKNSVRTFKSLLLK